MKEGRNPWGGKRGRNPWGGLPRFEETPRQLNKQGQSQSPEDRKIAESSQTEGTPNAIDEREVYAQKTWRGNVFSKLKEWWTKYELQQGAQEQHPTNPSEAHPTKIPPYK